MYAADRCENSSKLLRLKTLASFLLSSQVVAAGSSSGCTAAGSRCVPYLWTANHLLSHEMWKDYCGVRRASGGEAPSHDVVQELYMQTQAVVDKPEIAFITVRFAQGGPKLLRAGQLVQIQHILRLALFSYGNDVECWLRSICPPVWSLQEFRAKREAVACWAILTRMQEVTSCQAAITRLVHKSVYDRVSGAIRFPRLHGVSPRKQFFGLPVVPEARDEDEEEETTNTTTTRMECSAC